MPGHEPELTRRGVLAAGLAAAATAPSRIAPVGLLGTFAPAVDCRFGRTRRDGTVRDMADLRRNFRTRYIYDHGRLDGLDSYWSKHRDYPDGDPRALHVFAADHLALKGRVPAGGGLRPGGIESGMLRCLAPVLPGMVVEMRARLPRGLGVWPAFWLNPGVERPDGTFSTTPWPPEIDIFEFFVWQGRTRPMLLTAHVQDAGRPHDFGDPQVLMSKFDSRGNYDSGIDFSSDFHIFALDWQPDRPRWLVDGQVIQETRYAWGNAPPAHVLITNQIGMSLPGTDMTGMADGGSDWDYCVDYLRVWRRL